MCVCVCRVELWRQLKQTRMEKRQLRTLLKEYEKNFLIKNGRYRHAHTHTQSQYMRLLLFTQSFIEQSQLVLRKTS